MYYIDIKDALFFIVICVVVLEILGKMACFIDSKYPIRRALPKIHFAQTLYRKANSCVFVINHNI